MNEFMELVRFSKLISKLSIINEETNKRLNWKYENGYLVGDTRIDLDGNQARGKRDDLVSTPYVSGGLTEIEAMPVSADKILTLRYSKTTASPVTSSRMCTARRAQKFPNSICVPSGCSPVQFASRPTFFLLNENGNEPLGFSQNLVARSLVLRPR